MSRCSVCKNRLTTEDKLHGMVSHCVRCYDNLPHCDNCNVLLETDNDVHAGVCAECDEYRCTNCGTEYDEEYHICECGEMDPHVEGLGDFLSDSWQDK